MDYPVFISTSLGTHLAVVVSDGDTVDDVKRKIRTEYSLCFSNKGEINICSVKVKRKGFNYHLSDSMLIKSAFDGIKGSWFLYIDVESKSLTNNQVKFLENVIESNGVQLQTPALNEREHGTNNEGTVDFHVTCSPSAAQTDYGSPPVSPTTGPQVTALAGELGKKDGEVNDSLLSAPNSSQHELVGPAEDIPKKDSHTGGRHKEKSERKKRKKHKDRHEDIPTEQGQSKAPEFVKAATESISVVPSEKNQKEETSKGKQKLDTYAMEDHGDIHAKAQAQSNQDHPTNAPNSSQHELVGPAEDIPKKDSHTGGRHKEKSERKKRKKHKDRHEDIPTEQGQSMAPEFVKAATESISVVPSEKKQKVETSKEKQKLDTYAVEDHGDIHAKAQAQSNQDHPTNDQPRGSHSI